MSAGEIAPVPGVPGDRGSAVDDDVDQSTPTRRWPASAAVYQDAVVLSALGYLAASIALSPGAFARPEFAAWFLAVVVVSLLAVPGPRGMRLGMDFAISIALAVLYGPAAAALVMFAGSFDPRELRGEVTPRRALFNRSRFALATALAAVVFHSVADVRAPIWSVVLASVPAVMAGYGASLLLVGVAVRLDEGRPFPEIVARFTPGGIPQFVLGYLTLGVVAAAMTGIQRRVEGLTAIALIPVLLIARYLYVRGQTLERATRDLERSTAQLRMLQGIAGKLHRLNDVTRIAEAIVEDLGTVIEYHDCRVYLLQADGVTLWPVAFLPEPGIDDGVVRERLVVKVGEGITGRAVATGRTVNVPDALHCEFAQSIPGTPEIPESIVAVPLLRGEQAFGAVVLSKEGLGQFDEQEVMHLEVLSSRAAVAFENARLLERERGHVRWYRSFVEQLPALTYIERLDGSVVYVSPQLHALLGRDPAEWAAEAGNRVASVHPDDREAVRAARERSTATGEACVVEYRMLHADGRVVWVRDEATLVRGAKGRPYWQGVIVDITDRRRADEQIAFLAFHDKLTELPNRTRFEELLEQAVARAKRQGTAVAVVALDLDDFKLVNDSLGHETGDEILRRASAILREVARETDVAARMGGDEFLVMLPDLPSIADGLKAVAATEAFVRRLQDRLRAPLDLDRTDYYLSASVGISVYPLDAEDGESLVRNADAAMYESKRSSRGAYTIYARPSSTTTQLSLVTRLRRAVEERRWQLHYQPVYELSTRRPVAAEALIRWQEPDGRLIAPSDFIGLAEEMGVIGAIGEWVARELFRQLVEWREQGLSIEASFNLSPRQLWDPRVAQDALLTLEDSGLDPASIVVEITESAVMTDAGTVNRAVESLHEVGVRLAIDDFGTGHSSLSRLKDLPVDIVKIDRSFVAELATSRNAGRIVDAMIRLVESLGLVPVAEGIETQRQLRFLREHGCAYGQGYLLSRPVPGSAIPELFAAGAGERARPMALPGAGPGRRG